MVGPLFDDGVERVEVVGEPRSRGRRRDVASVDVDPVGNLVPDGGVAEPTPHRVPRSRNDAPLLVAEMIFLQR